MEVTTFSINPNHMFSGQLEFLSNMYPCTLRMYVLDKTYTFSSSEAAFHAGKCQDPADIQRIAATKTGNEAKRLGRKVKMRPNWDTYRISWMARVLECKFRQNPELAQQLLDTYPLTLRETNTWKDTFWGIYKGQGENHLGILLMELRQSMRQAGGRKQNTQRGEVDILRF